MTVFFSLRPGAAAALACTALLSANAFAAPGRLAPAATAFPDDPVRVAVEQFLQRQTVGLPGKVNVQVVPPSGGRAPECVAPDPFLPNGTAQWGRISVGIRCGGERPWIRYMQARVSVTGPYYVAARALAPGEPLDVADMELREGDLGSLPRAVVTDPSQVLGAVMANRVAAGSPIRTDLLKKSMAVRQGQTVAVVVEGEGFSISSEGKIMADAPLGNSVQVRLKGGQVVNAVVRTADTVVLQQ